MRRSTLTSLLVLCLVTAAPAWAQPSPGELSVVLSSLSSEALDPILAGHIVKFYLSLMFDYLVGATPDGQLSPDGGRRQALDLSPAARRQVSHRRRADRRGREGQHPARAGAALDDRLCPGAPPARQGDRDAGARPRRHRHEGRERDDPDALVAAPLDRGDDPAEEIPRGEGRRRLRAGTRRVGPLPLCRAGLG